VSRGKLTIVSGNCERARAWASLEVDGELSELEQALLGAHLERCESCRAHAAGVRGLEQLLRAQELEPLSRPVAIRAVSSSRPLRILQLGAALAVVATGGLAALVAGVFHATSEQSATPLQRVSVIGDESPRTMRELRRIVLVTDSRKVSRHLLEP
jgi:predicted anti-sigma-YlaC factor YlaD